MKKIAILVRREFWEHKNIFLILPAVIGGFILILMLLGLFYESAPIALDIEMHKNGSSELLSVNANGGGNWAHIALRGLLAKPVELRPGYIEWGFEVITALLSLILWIVIVTYLLGTLLKTATIVVCCFGNHCLSPTRRLV